MKTMMMVAIGGPGVLELRDVPDPVPGGDELLIRLRAAGINPLDWKMRKKGTRFPDRLPSILGCDGAGVVEKVGENVTKFKEGDEVYYCHGGIGDDPGNYAELAVINERYASRKPASLGFIEAAGSPLALITAWESLHDRARIQGGQKVLIHGGAGGVGHLAIQIAKVAGCRVCTTVSSKEKGEFVQKLGADKVIFYKDEDFVQSALKWSDGKGVDVVFDTVGGEIFSKSLSAVRYYGDLVTILAPPAEMNWGVARVRNIRVSFELMLTPMTDGLDMGKRHHAEILEKCAHLFDEGKMTIHIDRTYPLEEVGQAHTFMESGAAMGKVVLKIG